MAELVAFLLSVWLAGALLSSFYFWARKTDGSQPPVERRLVAAGYGLSWPVVLVRQFTAGPGTRRPAAAHPASPTRPTRPADRTPVPPPGPECRSPLLRGFAGDLAEVLPADQQGRLTAMLAQAGGDPGLQDEARAYLTLDWFVRTWVPSWAVLVPEAGEQLAAQLRALPHIRDVQSAGHAGRLIGALSDAPATAEQTAEAYRASLLGDVAVTAARGAASRATTQSAGPAAVRAAASRAPEACQAARTDLALKAATAIALSHSLDAVVPRVEAWAAGPGEIEAKRISTRNLAPVVAWQELESVVQPLQRSVGELYWSLVTLGR